MGFWADEARRACDAALDPHSADHTSLAEWAIRLALAHDDLIEENKRLKRQLIPERIRAALKEATRAG